MTEYKRVGRCQPKKCGAFCCRIGPYILRVPKDKLGKPKDDPRYYYYNGCMNIHETSKYIYLAQNVACGKLRGSGCSIYKDRPKICQEFPASPDHEWYQVAKAHGCTYRFKKVNKRGYKNDG